ncbi:hypothetical protein [Chelativorans sp. M5D2P16]|uniref:hypothetical protein n=1 Tax=Chelativorans sp. M5D2P16 TaxID=3095678 RepID=UPI002ACAC7B3|nr:hypothetical protein [Chelativorans sp. M5D2P16]MDZ5697463.1 hypothetical protein [Chelativorans sp. M5D2P16]
MPIFEIRPTLGTVRPGETVDKADLSNPWAVFDNDIDRVVIECVNTLTPEWEDKMAGRLRRLHL